MEEENNTGQPQAPAPETAAAERPARPSPALPWLKFIAILYVIALVAALVVIAKVDNVRKLKQEEMDLYSITSLGSSGKNAVAVIPIFGAIYPSDSSRVWERGSQQIARRIRAASERKEVKAILLDINSPGGSVGSVQEIYSSILRAKAETRKPFIAHFGDVSASGGYYIAAACDKIIAQPGTITGSIGVIFSVSSFSGLMNKIGMRNEAIKSGKFKDIGSPARAMTPEERKLLQALIDDTYAQFVQAVSEGRGMPLPQVKALADGRIFSGRQALEVKLVDKLGDLQDAIDLAGEMGHIGKNPRVVRDADPWEQFFSILDSKLNLPGASALEHSLNVSPRLEYRWYGI